MPDEPTKDWRDYQYDAFMLRQKEMALKKGQTSSLAGELAVTQFPDKSIASSAIQPGPLVGDFIISSGSLSSRDYSRFGTGWSLNSDGTISGITALAAPGGSNMQVQYNDNGTLAGASGITWNKNPSVTGLHGGLTVIAASSSASAVQSIGGRVRFDTGDGSPSGGDQSSGGHFTILTGDASANASQCSGGDFYLGCGDSSGNGTQSRGGRISLYAGEASGVGSFCSGGSVTIAAGDTSGANTSTSAIGGDILIYSGDATNASSVSRAGGVYIQTGSAAGTGDGGKVDIWFGSKGPTSSASKKNAALWLSGYSGVLSGNIADDYMAGLIIYPGYDDKNKGYTLTRHNYITLYSAEPYGTTTITDACVFWFPSAAGTHKAVDSGTTKTSPGTVSAWVKVNVNGTVHYIPSYTSKTT